MELKEKEASVIILSGKARSGKDTTAGYMKEYFEGIGKKTIILQFSSYIKEYAKKISDWDGSEETKPRELLQELGTSVIREKIDEEFFIKRIIGDIKVYSFFFDYVIISDARAKKEIINVKETFKEVASINIDRPNYDNGLSNMEKTHFTEKDLDDFDGYDYILVNDGSLCDLREKVIDLIKEMS